MSRFKEIEGYPNYFITDCGDVYSSKHGDMKKLSQRINSRGYFYVNLCKGGKYKSVSVHRIVGKHFVEKHEGLDIINHIDGCKTNNNYKNLEWCTLKHNSSEAFRIGLSKANKNMGNRSVLTKDIADIIREEYSRGGCSYNKLALKYNCSKGSILNVIKNRSWT